MVGCAIHSFLYLTSKEQIVFKKLIIAYFEVERVHSFGLKVRSIVMQQEQRFFWVPICAITVHKIGN